MPSRAPFLPVGGECFLNANIKCRILPDCCGSDSAASRDSGQSVSLPGRLLQRALQEVICHSLAAVAALIWEEGVWYVRTEEGRRQQHSGSYSMWCWPWFRLKTSLCVLYCMFLFHTCTHTHFIVSVLVCLWGWELWVFMVFLYCSGFAIPCSVCYIRVLKAPSNQCKVRVEYVEWKRKTPPIDHR